MEKEVVEPSESENEINATIHSNPNYVRITEQMEDVHERQIALTAKLDEIVTQIHGLEAEWNDLYNMRLALKNIIKNKTKVKLAEEQKATN